MTSSEKSGALGAMAGALALVVLAGIHITHGTFDSELTSAVDYLNDSAFTISLLATIPALLALRAHRGASARGVLIVAIGQALVATGVVAGLVTGSSPDWFAAVGVPGNLLCLIGWIVLARWSWKTGTYPKWIAVLMALVIPVGLAGAEIGGSLLPAALWVALGRDLAGQRLRGALGARAPRAGARAA